MSKLRFIPELDKPVCHCSTTEASPSPRARGRGSEHRAHPLLLQGQPLALTPGLQELPQDPAGPTALSPLCPKELGGKGKFRLEISPPTSCHPQVSLGWVLGGEAAACAPWSPGPGAPTENQPEKWMPSGAVRTLQFDQGWAAGWLRLATFHCWAPEPQLGKRE